MSQTGIHVLGTSGSVQQHVQTVLVMVLVSRELSAGAADAKLPLRPVYHVSVAMQCTSV